MNILTDYSDYIIGIPALFISSLLAYYIYMRQKRKKKLTYRIESITTIIDNSNKRNDRLTISFDNTVVNYLEVWAIKFFNDGNVPILRNDLIKPIQVSFGSSEIMDVKIMDPENLNIDIEYRISKNLLELNYDLLNPNESFSIELYLNQKSKIKMAGRIVGVSKISYYKDNEVTKYFLMLVSIIPLVISIYLLSDETFKEAINSSLFLKFTSPMIGLASLYAVYILVMSIRDSRIPNRIEQSRTTEKI